MEVFPPGLRQNANMTDYFSLLGEPKRPWLDPAALRDRFLALSTPVHPDRLHGATEEAKKEASHRYAELNAAYQCLKEPKDRLLHLFELETGEKTKDIQRIPPGTMDFFAQVGQMCRDVDAFLIEKEKASSPMVKVQLFEKGMDWSDRLNELQAELNARQAELATELEGMNPLWEAAPVSGPDRQKFLPLERLEQIYRTFSYISRWTSQLQERAVQLAI